MGMVGTAFELALKSHAGQQDKLGEAYIAHLVRVSAGCKGDQAQTVALLHDILEDTAVPRADLEALFTPEIVQAVEALTKQAGSDYASYLERVALNPLARQVKLSDLADNSNPDRMARLDLETRARLTSKYDRAKSYLLAQKD